MHGPTARRLPLPYLEIINPLQGFIGTEDQARNKPADMFKSFRTTKDLSKAFHSLGQDLRYPNNRQHGFTLLFLSHPSYLPLFSPFPNNLPSREVEVSRHIQWQGHWRRVDEMGAELRQQHPESFRKIKVSGRNGEEKVFLAFTKGVRLKRYGRKRLVIVHEQEDLTDAPRFLLTDALHWESGRVIQSWSYRWASEVFHEFGKQVCGLESAQVRKEEAVIRHFRLSCVAQSLVQCAPAAESESERYAFAAGKKTYGQKCRAIYREALRSLLELCKRYFAEGKSCDEVLEVLMPA